ncbi:MAG: hypothetical protein ACPG47_07995 [Leucothrix sp.]
MSNSQSARLFFWFLWLSGVFLGFFLIGQFLNHSVIGGSIQKATPYFLGFVWQCLVQLASLKSYQHSTRSREPLLIQLGGSIALVVIVVFILVLRS